MLVELKGNTAVVRCERCGTETEHILDGRTSPFLEEFGEFENLPFSCVACPAVEIFNMNIPINELDENPPLNEMPIKEEVQRYYIRLLMSMVRADLKR